MRTSKLIPIAVLAFAAACSDTATSPTSVGGPLFAVTPGTFGNVTTLNAAGTPSGGHLQSGGPISCVVAVGTFAITCSSNGAYQINGIGNKNATGSLSASYSATVDCTNNGGQLVEVKSTPQSATANTGSLSPENGHLIVPQVTVQPPTTQQFLNAARCPNKNWTKSLAGGTITLESFTYSLTFQGFQAAAVSISAS